MPYSAQMSLSRCSSWSPLGGPTRLDGQDRLGVLAPSDPPGHLDQLPAVAELLEVEEDHVGLVVLVQVLEQLGLRHPRLVPKTDELGEADLFLAGVVEHGGAQGPGLAEEGDPAGVGHLSGEGRIEADLGVGIDGPQAIGADHRDAVFCADLLEPLFEFDALGADLAESGRDDDHRLDPLLAALLQRAVDHVGREDDHRQVDVVLDVDHVAVGADRADAPLPRGHRIDRPLVARRQDVVEDVVGDGARRGGHADHSHTLGVENAVQRVEP